MFDYKNTDIHNAWLEIANQIAIQTTPGMILNGKELEKIFYQILDDSVRRNHPSFRVHWEPNSNRSGADIFVMEDIPIIKEKSHPLFSYSMWPAYESKQISGISVKSVTTSGNTYRISSAKNKSMKSPEDMLRWLADGSHQDKIWALDHSGRHHQWLEFDSNQIDEYLLDPNLRWETKEKGNVYAHGSDGFKVLIRPNMSHEATLFVPKKLAKVIHEYPVINGWEEEPTGGYRSAFGSSHPLVKNTNFVELLNVKNYVKESPE